jgi:hypothetical protein
MKRFRSIAKHPLTLLAISSVLSYALIPWISEKSAHARLIQQQRMSQALDILKQSVADDQELNMMTTSFGLFCKNAASNPRIAKKLQRDEMTAFSAQYARFDQHAWWWRHDLATQSKLLLLPSGSKEEIETLSARYDSSLMDSAAVVDKLRDYFLGKSFSPQNARNRKMIDAAAQDLTKFSIERGAIASQLSRMFMPPDTKW